MYSPSDNAVRIPVSAYSYLQTVSQNRSHFTCREVQGADAARKLYKQVGWPSHARFLSYLQQGLIRNSPVTLDDAHRAWHIYGPDIAYLKGKTTQRSPLLHIETPTTLPATTRFHRRPSHRCHLMRRCLLCAEATLPTHHLPENRVPNHHSGREPIQDYNHPSTTKGNQVLRRLQPHGTRYPCRQRVRMCTQHAGNATHGRRTVSATYNTPYVSKSAP